MPTARKIRPKGQDRVADRITDLVNLKFGGNITQAAEAIGCSYDQLYTAATGRYSRGVPLNLVIQVCQYFELTIETLTRAREDNHAQPSKP